MTRWFTVVILVGLTSFIFNSSSILMAVPPASATANYGQLPISFEPNRGQFEAQFGFASMGPGYSLFVNSAGVTLKLRNTNTSKSVNREMRFTGSNGKAPLRGINSLPGEANYFRGSRENWLTHIPTYERVIAQNVYPGVDAVFYGNQNRVEYDFIVNPGASPETIGLAFPGSSKLRLADGGDLLISLGEQEIRQTKPTVYQEIDGQRSPVAGRYILRGSHRVGFQVGEYNHHKPLAIDPQVVYSIFGAALTRVYGVAVDSAGNAYVCGTTADGRTDTATDAWVAKLNATGTAFLWRASLGSSGYGDSATAIAVDASGNAYVTGWTIYDLSGPHFPPFPTTAKAIQPSPAAGWNAFVTKFDTNGNMVYSTYLGGDRADGIAVDSLGNMYVSGRTSSTNFPTSNAFQPALHGTSDAFVTVLNSQGSAFIYSTYLARGERRRCGDGNCR